MKCVATKEIKDCCLQTNICDSCNYEDCHESCLKHEKNEYGCNGCKFAIKTVYESIINYNLNKLAIYLHSWQMETYTIDEIKKLLNTEASYYECDE